MIEDSIAPRWLIALDPGHGGSDPGAVGPTEVEEKNITLAVSIKLRDLLTAAGCAVVMTRETDTDVSYPDSPAGVELQARVAVANNAGADVFISLHCNAAASPQAHGTETWYYHDGEPLAQVLTVCLADTGLANRGAKQGSFYVLKYTLMPAVLVEMAFITNPEEETKLADPAFQACVAAAIKQGLLSWLGQ